MCSEHVHLNLLYGTHIITLIRLFIFLFATLKIDNGCDWKYLQYHEYVNYVGTSWTKPNTSIYI